MAAKFSSPIALTGGLLIATVLAVRLVVQSQTDALTILINQTSSVTSAASKLSAAVEDVPSAATPFSALDNEVASRGLKTMLQRWLDQSDARANEVVPRF